MEACCDCGVVPPILRKELTSTLSLRLNSGGTYGLGLHFESNSRHDYSKQQNALLREFKPSNVTPVYLQPHQEKTNVR
ncbi:uncharacterized protein LOC111862290 isoform X2 [Cryptotermes secundus]|uniref:uncharacterized protein LOC111862290 isoform X2 n=1 Tax=Cryptotermes secundus TaxID=105785 RepID=UPI001454DC53|nr:uncharacterized protein LOC111862290 isoform X2 [Cryptotermes secundus]